MDPASAGALVSLLTSGGPWAVVVVVLGIVLRAWRSGEFISKPTHDTIVVATTQRYLDLLDRFNNQQSAIEKWREQAERVSKIAEAGQAQHAELLTRMEIVRQNLEELRNDFHGARVWREMGPEDNSRQPRNRRPAPDGG